MKSTINSALASVGEVAAFAFTLLDLLITRVLPLLGFLIAHSLLHFCRFVASLFVPPPAAAGRRASRLHRANKEQQSYGDFKPLNSITASTLFAEEILNDYELQEQPQPSQAQPAITAHPAAAQDRLPQAPQLKPFNAQTVDLRPSAPPINGQQTATASPAAEPVDVARSAPSDIEATVHHHSKQKVVDEPSDLRTNEQSQASDFAMELNVDASESETSDTDGKAVKEGHVEESESSMKQSTQLVAGGHPFTRVLPPSLSQIKRTLMQRSRGSASSPPLKPSSSPGLKKPSPRIRKLVSTMKSSPSQDNFFRNFRKHFLLDSPKITR